MAKRFSKRGMSPLIATLLLIATAVAIGTSIMSWGITFYGEQTTRSKQELLCSRMELEVNKIGDVQQICYDAQSNKISFTVTNKANIAIDAFIVWIVSKDTSKDIYVSDLNQVLKPGYPLKKEINYDFNVYGAINQVHLIPKIKKLNSEEQMICSDEKLVLENIRPC